VAPREPAVPRDQQTPGRVFLVRDDAQAVYGARGGALDGAGVQFKFPGDLAESDRLEIIHLDDVPFTRGQAVAHVPAHPAQQPLLDAAPFKSCVAFFRSFVPGTLFLTNKLKPRFADSDDFLVRLTRLKFHGYLLP
jgi:hypothetical protein